ncbi:hypothetical protein VI817_005788 [Penicillium citrinum]|nr:hypothetical protein VI817_005788 [Penicillium citrinum]
MPRAHHPQKKPRCSLSTSVPRINNDLTYQETSGPGRPPVGSLFSIISPTARASRASSGTSPSGALAPSLAADLHISESPVNYFARKNNIFNVYFVKIGWLWTTLAFASLLICQPAYRSSSQQQTRSRRILQAVLRYAFATSVWYLMTQWFFGPAIIDRGFVVTGGKCEQVMDKVENLGPQASESPSAQLETLFSAAACKAAGGAWAGGHDISGHVFMLVLATAFLSFEAIGVGAFAAPSTTPQDKGEASRTRKSSDPASLSVDEQSDSSDPLRRLCLRLVWGVVGLGWWMLFMTAIWFHTWLEKWSGLAVALGTVYVLYILPRTLAPWRDVIGVPGV